MKEDIGCLLRDERKKRNLSIRALAQKSGLSPTIISRIENGHTSPSFSTVTKIIKVFNINFSQLFNSNEKSQKCPIIRKKAMKNIYGLGEKLHTILVNPWTSQTVQLFFEEYEPGGSNAKKTASHNSVEVGICIKGTLQVQLPTGVYSISAGDGWFFTSEIPHRFFNNSNRKAIILFADVANPL